MARLKRPTNATPLMRAATATRLAYRMSQREFAEYLTVPRSRISLTETGWTVPTDTFLEPIAKAAGVTVDELRAGVVAINRCGCCKGRGVEFNEKRTVQRMPKESVTA